MSGDLTKNYKLNADLDLDGEIFSPLGTFATGFSGNFDGNDHTISNWSYAASDASDASGYPGPIENDLCDFDPSGAPGNCDDPQDPTTVHADFAVGFFRTLESGATVKGLTLANATVKGRFYTGGLVGYMRNGSSVEDSHVTTLAPGPDVTIETTGIIIGYNDHPTGSTSGRTGGVVGQAEVGTTITTSTFAGDVRGAMHVAGIVGNSLGSITFVSTSGRIVCRDGNCGGVVGNLGEGAGGLLEDSSSTATLVGINNGGAMGGVAGSMNALSVINRCHYNGTIGGTFAIGGFVGVMNGGTVTKSYSLGSVTGSLAAVGGFAGWIYGGGAVSDSFANTDVTFGADAQWFAGGGAGFVAVANVAGQAASLERVYAAGTVTGSTGGLTQFADLVANASAASSVVYSFADENISANGLILVSGGTVTASFARTTTDMKNSTNYTSAGWDFATVWQIDPAVNDGYPTLR